MSYLGENKKTTTVNVSMFSIVKVFFVLFVLYFIYLIGNIIAILFVSLILAGLITPWVDWMQKKKIPRGLGIVFIYLGLFLFIAFAVYSIIPPILEQFDKFSKDSPEYLDRAFSSITALKEKAESDGVFNNIKKGLSAITSDTQGAVSGVFATVSGFLGGMVSLVLILVITFYMVSEENAMKKIIWSLVPEKHQPYLIQLFARMQKKIGMWLRGQLILSLIIFVLTYIGLYILGVEYPLVLALIAAITEFVPYLGPVIAAIPAILIAFVQSPILALFVFILYYVIQMLENNLIVPKLMQKVVGLNPIVIIVVLLVGFKLYGIVGAMLAIPVATAASVFLKDLFEKKKAVEEN